MFLFFISHGWILSGQSSVSFCGWLISLSTTKSRFICAVACVRISFLFKAEWYSTVWLSSHLSVDLGATSNFTLLWIMLLWTWVSKCLFNTLLSILNTHTHTKWLLDHMVIFSFFFLRNCFVVFNSSYITWHSYQQCKIPTNFPHISLILSFLTADILIHVRWCHIVVWFTLL